MKKILIIIFIIFFLAITCIGLLGLYLSRENTEFEFQLNNIEIVPLSDTKIDLIKENLYFEEHTLTDKQLDDFEKNPNHYKEIVLTISLINNSKNITMNGILIGHNFVDKLKDRVVAYDECNGDITTFLFPEDSLNNPRKKLQLKQRILVKTLDMTDDEILELFRNGKCYVTYFTGPFSEWDGKRFYGRGKHVKEYKVQDILSHLGTSD